MGSQSSVCVAVHPDGHRRCRLHPLHVRLGYPVHIAEDGAKWRSDGKVVCRDCGGHGHTLAYRPNGTPGFRVKCAGCDGTGVTVPVE